MRRNIRQERLNQIQSDLDFLAEESGAAIMRDHLRREDRKRWMICQIEAVRDRDLRGYYDWGLDKKLLKLLEE